MSPDDFFAAWSRAYKRARQTGRRYAVVRMGGLLVPLSASLAGPEALAVTMDPLFMLPEDDS